MTRRSLGMIGIVAALGLAAPPALAFSGDRPSDDGGSDYQSEPPDEPPPADYRYSGNGFNVSMSRDPAAPSDESRPAATDESRQADQPDRPGFFGRIFHDLFGG